ncbi:hypothetical protein Fmac_031310 [Flemingia macrophylla]|uniref:Exocyst subunit Exo70 family protein n=1 Tax=Flemingia macrophylla TaxID=520843 RepID=A0ABD1L1Q3_9FABA
MVCTKLTIRLLSFIDIIITSGSYLRNHLFSSVLKMSESLHQLTQLLESSPFRFSGVGALLRGEANNVLKRSDILIELENIIYRNTAQAFVSGGGLHPITKQVMKNIRGLYITDSHIWRAIEEYDLADPNRAQKSLFSVIIARVIELLERNLEAMSRNYNSAALGYVFMMNNLQNIGNQAGSILGHDWLKKNRAKVDQNLELYLTSSWNKMLDFLKLESDDSLPWTIF